MKTRRWMTCEVPVIAIAVLCSATSAFAQRCPEQVDIVFPYEPYVFRRDVGCAPHLMEVLESYAILVASCRDVLEGLRLVVVVMDVSDPEGPRIVGFDSVIHSCNVCTLERDIAVSGDRLFFISSGPLGGNAIKVVDLSDPSNPSRAFVEISIEDNPPSPWEIEVFNGRAYVATPAGLTILDLSDADTATEIGYLEFSWTPSDLVVAGGIAYVTDPEAGLWIIDVSDPALPVEAGHWAASWEAKELEVSGGFAYVADGDGGLRIIDVTDPGQPFDAGAFATPDTARNVSVEGSLAAVAMGSEGVSIIDVSNPSNPVEMDRYTMRAPAYDVALKGKTAHIAVGQHGVTGFRQPVTGFRVVDVSIPERATERASIEFAAQAMDVVVSEDAVFMANGDLGLSVSTDTGVGWLDTPGFAVGVTLAGDVALVADDHKGLRIIDVSDPLHLAEIGFVDTPGQARRVVVSGGLAFVADGDAGLRIIDFSSPADPEEVGFVDTPGRAVDVAVSGEWVFVADGPAGVCIIDASDPSKPMGLPISYYPTESVEVVGQHLIVGTGTVLEKVDISNPRLPGFLFGPRRLLRGEATDIKVVGDSAYVATRPADRDGFGPSGIDVFDLGDPLTRLGRWDSSGDALAVTVSGGRVYVAGGEQGVPILDTRCLMTYWVELVAHNPGVKGSVWRTDVIVKPQLRSGYYDRGIHYGYEVGIEFKLHTPDGLFTAEATITPEGTGVFEDIVGLLGYEGKGALEIRADHPVWVYGRVYSVTDSGTWGAYLPGYRSSECLEAKQGAHLPGLRQKQGEFRTNISVTNVGDEAQQVEVFLSSADGDSIHHYYLWVEPGMTVQDLQPFKRRAKRPNLGWGNAYVVGEKHGILASASVIDSQTNDTVMVPMVAVPEETLRVK